NHQLPLIHSHIRVPMMINSPSPITAVPDELIAEVLSLLTVKSLLRLKCVSKSWNSLISDPFFVKIHSHKSSQNTNLTLFWAKYSGCWFLQWIMLLQARVFQL
ncbi:hypothetical protein KIW84_010424, partial [Lathyrus oleraceus]